MILSSPTNPSLHTLFGHHILVISDHVLDFLIMYWISYDLHDTLLLTEAKYPVSRNRGYAGVRPKRRTDRDAGLSNIHIIRNR